MASESRRTVVIAAIANLVIALAKFVAGAISGSAAILAEAAHSVADTGNQVFLLVSLRMGERPADEEHPFGYGKERFFWAFIAAIGIFVLGAGFSFLQGITGLISGHQEDTKGFVAAYVVLAISAVAEGTSWFRAYRQTKSQAREQGMGFREFVRESKDPTVKTVLLEDTGALTGIAIAFVGIGLSEITGVHAYDPIASILIGCLLAYIAFRLGRNTKGLLLGESAREEDREKIRRAIEDHEGVDRVLELLTMVIGPESLMVAARADLGTGMSADDVERLADETDRRVREAVPSVTFFFLDPTPPHGADREVAQGRRAG
ncbi:MAG TPA: cation diffusion facilitator family transporter [Actinomycetota bacterium]|nr:cation diffusion facilitator family transporter [Actinomycetota bacterium]